MKIVCTPNLSFNETQARNTNTISVNLYELKTQYSAGIGRRLIKAIERWNSQPTQTAWDFLSIALGVIASDTFVRRDETADGWTREIELTVAVHNPSPWLPMISDFEQVLRFLSGDIWRLTIVEGGEPVPRIKKPGLVTEDCVCLFSGGLDSFIGSLDLVSNGKSPILVSHAYPKERQKQVGLAPVVIPNNIPHFIENVHPQWIGKNETSMRARSILFLALGVLIASGLDEGKQNLYIPENGFISLNIPLTIKRVASLSTKTTHPYFIQSIQEIINVAGIPVQILNPYQFKTKGEMLSECQNQNVVAENVINSVSCGKWKRKNKQCGKCVPCIIRRAALNHAGINDLTPYSYPDLHRAVFYAKHDELDDLKATQFAIEKFLHADLKRVVLRSAPFPFSEDIRNSFVDIVKRGLDEINNFIP